MSWFPIALGLVLALLPAGGYYAQALFGLGGARFALFVARGRFPLTLAAVACGVWALASGMESGAHLVAFAGLLLMGLAWGLFVVISRRAIDSRFVPLDDPSPTHDPLPPGSIVIGVELGGRARAYSVELVAARHVVNDVVGGVPVSVTYCPLAQAASVVRATVDDRRLYLHAAAPWRGHFLLAESTGPAWSQLTGQAAGAPAPPLELLPAELTSWERWKSRHPETELVALPADPGECAPPPVGLGDDPALAAMVVLGGARAGVELEPLLANPEQRVEPGGTPVTIRRDPADGTISATLADGTPAPVIVLRRAVWRRL